MGSQPDGVDRIRRSFAVLGLRPGTPLPEVRRRYRFLAQRWHPDRYAADARNQAEAGAEMRRINEAYQAVVESQTPSSTGASSGPARRLSPEEIDAISRAIGSDGPVDWALGSIGWVGNAIEGLFGILCGVGLAIRLLVDIPRGNFSVFREHPEIILVALVLLVLVVRELVVRQRIGNPASRKAEP